MDLSHLLLLVVAGVAAGAVNAIAGGGSLITFPSLIAVGLPPVAANVTNSVAVCPGYVSSVVGSRADLAGQAWRLRRIVPSCLAGSVVGCALLLLTPARAFELVVPFLVLAAAATLAFQDRLRGLVGHPRALSPRRQAVTLQAVVFVGAIYGGYFGAALGVMYVAALALILDGWSPSSSSRSSDRSIGGRRSRSRRPRSSAGTSGPGSRGASRPASSRS
jgi:uncharacterized membrane protein YfcA